MELLLLVFITTMICFFAVAFSLFLILFLIGYDLLASILTFVIFTSFSIIVLFFNFLLSLSLKIKTEFRETLRYEIDKNRRVYEFVRKRGEVTLEELIEEVEDIKPDDVSFSTKWREWEDFLKERVENLKTLEGDKKRISLPNEVNKFFVYENPNLKDLLNYIFFVYIKKQEYPFVKAE